MTFPLKEHHPHLLRFNFCKTPKYRDFTVFGMAVTLQQIFVIPFRMNFELVFQMREFPASFFV